MTARFELRPKDTAPHLAVELHGDVDTTNAAEFERQLGAKTSAGPLILDLSQAAYFDSAAFLVLDRLVASGAVVAVISPSSLIRRAASLIGVSSHDTVDQAMDALTRTAS